MSGPTRFVARVEHQGGQAVAVPLFAGYGVTTDLGQQGETLDVGDIVELAVEAQDVACSQLAAASSAMASMYEIAAGHQLNPIFTPEVEGEVAQLVANPGFDDPSLTDLTGLAFVTIDNPDSRDLDQAMYIERDGAGFRVAYALADAAYYVRPGTALFAAAVRRGASFYLPGFSVPMLPTALSEGLVSLNPDVTRRAFVFDMHLDGSGELVRTELYRGLIRSRAKLSYPGVQAFHDGTDGGAHSGRDFTETLQLLRAVGEARMQLAFERDVVRYRRRTLSVGVTAESPSFTLMAGDRNDVERWNEQLSLLCNTEGARLLLDAGATPGLQAIFRVHDPPHHRRVDELEGKIRSLSRRANLAPETFCWHRAAGQSLAQFLDQLPHGDDDEDGAQSRRSRAITRLALVINNRSEFSDEPGPHHGVGAPAYARFSSPMREIVGVFTHKEAAELLELAAPADIEGDVALQQQIIEAGNRAKRLQSRITKEANGIAIDAVLKPDLAVPRTERPWRTGTLMGVTRSRAYVLLDSPPVEVKVYFSASPGMAAETSGDGLELRLGGQQTLTLGDEVAVRVGARAGDRWQLELRGG